MREVIWATIVAGTIAGGGLWLGWALKQAEAAEYQPIPIAWLVDREPSQRTQ